MDLFIRLSNYRLGYLLVLGMLVVENIHLGLGYQLTNNSINNSSHSISNAQQNSNSRFFNEIDDFETTHTPQSAKFISPFDAVTFGQQLLPLLSANVETKVKKFVSNMNSGVTVLHTALKNNLNRFKAIAESQHKPVFTKYHPPTPSMLNFNPVAPSQPSHANHPNQIQNTNPPPLPPYHHNQPKQHAYYNMLKHLPQQQYSSHPKNVSQLHTSVYSAASAAKPKPHLKVHPYPNYYSHALGQSSLKIYNRVKVNPVPKEFTKDHVSNVKVTEKERRKEKLNLEKKEKRTLESIEQQTEHEYKNIMEDMGVKGYKDFERTVLRDLEKQEEAKVEATLDSMLDSDDDDAEASLQHDIYANSNDWLPMVANSNGDGTTIVMAEAPKLLQPSAINEPFVIKQMSGEESYDSGEFVGIPREGPTSTYQLTNIERPQINPSKKRTRTNYDSQQEHEPEYIQDLSSNALPATPKTKPRTRNHVQSLTTVRPSARQQRHQPIAEESHALNYVITPPTSLARRKPTTSGRSPANGGSSWRPTPVSATTQTPRSLHLKATANTQNNGNASKNKRFIDKPKATGYRGSVKFSDSNL